MDLSVTALTDRVLPGMRAKKWARIITSTSSGVIAPIPNLGLSNSLRAALVGWSKTLARKVGRDGITAKIILPGSVATDRITFLDEQNAQREGRSTADVSAESIASIPIGRYGARRNTAPPPFWPARRPPISPAAPPAWMAARSPASERPP